MDLIIKDRVKETTTTEGTGTITLAGASTGFRSFADIGNANTTYYCISGGSQFEVGLGTYTASGTTLSRDTVLSNSLGTTALINFSAGTKDVFCTYPSDKALLGSTSSVSSTGTGSVVLSDSPTFTTAITSTGSLQLTGNATAVQNIATNQTTGSLTIGGTAQTSGTINIGGSNAATGTITLGRSTGNQTVGIATGVNALTVKTVNIGTGATGGTTTIAIGPTGTGNGITTINIGTQARNSSATTVNIGTNATGGNSNITLGSIGAASRIICNGIFEQRIYTGINSQTATAGRKAFVSDHRSATSYPIFGEAYSISGTFGPFNVPVFADGTIWRVG